MNILNIEKVTKIYGNRTMLNNVTLGINEGDKIGIIGINGTGKSTFLKIIAGLVTPDEGKVVMGNGIKVSYLPQNPEFEDGESVIDYVIKDAPDTGHGKNALGDAQSILNRLGIKDYNQKVNELSGGQKKRVALAKTILFPTEIIVMDEPTNHLDNDMVIWLEKFLKKFRGQLVMVTHDRYFLDRVTNKIVEIDKGNIYSYNTNYSGFLELKAQREEMMAQTEKKRQNILRNELTWIRAGAKARSTKQQARIDRFYEMKEASHNARVMMEKSSLEMKSISTRIGKKTIEINNLSKAYGDKKLFRNFSHIVLRDERIGIIGPNGCGKSTLLKVICGKLEPDSGNVEIGETIKIGYFMQDNEFHDESIRVIDYVKEIGEYITTVDGKITASQMCEKFLFTPDMQYTPISKLSGGEKRRLYLLSVLMSAPNVLVLDEPTNDLDIETLTTLEDYIDNFVGMVIVVSHDRYFLDRVVDRIFAFEGDGVVTQYEGGFSDYLDKAIEAGIVDETGSLITDDIKIVDESAKQNSKLEWQMSKQNNQKLKFTYSEQKEYETIDDDIAKLEDRIKKIDDDIMKFATDSGKLNDLSKERDELQTALDEKMERWVYLNDLAEKIEEQKKNK